MDQNVRILLAASFEDVCQYYTRDLNDRITFCKEKKRKKEKKKGCSRHGQTRVNRAVMGIKWDFFTGVHDSSSSAHKARRSSFSAHFRRDSSCGMSIGVPLWVFPIL